MVVGFDRYRKGVIGQTLDLVFSLWLGLVQNVQKDVVGGPTEVHVVGYSTYGGVQNPRLLHTLFHRDGEVPDGLVVAEILAW